MEAALVDIGNVLLKLRRNPAEVLLGSSPEERTRESFFQLYCCFESGLISEAEFVSRAIKITGFAGTSEELISIWCDIFDPMPDMWDWCARRKEEGMKLILFSNTNSLHRARFFVEPVFSLFDHGVYSDEIGEMKPGNAMYEYAIHHLGVNPARTIYVDDLEANIETGRRFGFQCSRFFPNDPLASVARLDAICR